MLEGVLFTHIIISIPHQSTGMTCYTAMTLSYHLRIPVSVQPLSIKIMTYHGLSRKVHHERLLKKTKSNTVLAVAFTIKDASMLNTKVMKVTVKGLKEG